MRQSVFPTFRVTFFWEFAETIMNKIKQVSAVTPRDKTLPRATKTPLETVRLGARQRHGFDARSLALIEPELFVCSTSFCMALHAERSRVK